jgi:hypothetical protein
MIVLCVCAVRQILHVSSIVYFLYSPPSALRPARVKNSTVESGISGVILCLVKHLLSAYYIF